MSLWNQPTWRFSKQVLGNDWPVCQAFTETTDYNYHIFLFVQDTLRAPPAENKSMKRATLIAILTTTGFYMSVGCVGYAAFGNASQGNLLTGFGFYNPYWLIDFANACVVVHLIGAYQVGLAFCLSPLSYKSILNTHKRIQFGRLVAFLGVCVCN